MSTLQQGVEVDGDKLMQFVFRAVDEVGATLNAALVVMGDKLGLYRALAGAGGLSPAELAARTGTSERYVREWLNAQAAGGYVHYDPNSGHYEPAGRANGHPLARARRAGRCRADSPHSELTSSVVMLTTFDGGEHVYRALRAGVSSYLLRDAPSERLIEAVRTAVAGDALIAPEITRRIIAEFAHTRRHRNGPPPLASRLSPRRRSKRCGFWRADSPMPRSRRASA